MTEHKNEHICKKGAVTRYQKYLKKQKEEKTMNYVVKDLPEIKLVEELLKYDPDVKEKLEMENDNTVIDIKKKIKMPLKMIFVLMVKHSL